MFVCKAFVRGKQTNCKKSEHRINYSAAALKSIDGCGGHGAPTHNSTGRGIAFLANSIPNRQRQARQDHHQGLGGDQEQTRDAREAHALKLSRIGKEAVININSYNTNKIQRAFEEILNYVGTNMDRRVAYLIHHALNTGVYYPFNTEVPTDPTTSSMAMDDMGSEE